MAPPVTGRSRGFSLRVFELVHLPMQRVGLSLKVRQRVARAIAPAPASDTASASALHA